MKICKSKLLFVFCMFPFLDLSIRHISFTTELAWKAVPGLLGFMILILRLRDDAMLKRNSIGTGKRNLIMLVVIYSMSILFSGIYNDALSIGVIYMYTIYLGVFLYIDYWMDDFDEFIKMINWMFIAVIIASFVLIVIYPAKAVIYLGAEKCYVGILGSKNAVQMTILPAIATLLVQYYYEEKNRQYKNFLLACVVLGIILLFLSKSGTAAIAASVLVIYLLVGRNLRFSSIGLFCSYLIIYFAIVIFRIQEKLFYDLIVNVLEKDITLSDRTIIWDGVLESMKYSPLIGYGPKNTVVLDFYLFANESHNGFLEIFVAGGMISLTLFIAILLVVGKELDRYKKHPVASILLVSIFIYGIMSLTESGFGYAKMLFWMMLIMSINIGSIIKQNRKEETG